MGNGTLHDIRCLSFSVVYKWRRIPSYDLTSLSSKLDRTIVSSGWYNRTRTSWMFSNILSFIFPSFCLILPLDDIFCASACGVQATRHVVRKTIQIHWKMWLQQTFPFCPYFPLEEFLFFAICLSTAAFHHSFAKHSVRCETFPLFSVITSMIIFHF